jgi:hypothetical protein
MSDWPGFENPASDGGCNQTLAWHTIAAPEKGYTMLVTNAKACRPATSRRPSVQLILG